jgi:EmrB/QacA subfamily drug resistance transporter
MSDHTDKRIVLIIACMAAFITPFLGSSVNIAIPTITGEFHADNFLMNWVVLGFLLSAAIFVVPFGRIADIFGRKSIFIAGLTVIVISSLLCSISNSVFMLIASRLVEGLGSAMIFGTLIAILTAAYPAKERGKVLGINVAITYLGLSAGPFIGGIITQYLGWRFIYGGITAYSLILAVLAYFLIKDNERCAEKGNFDIGGTALYAVMLLSLMYGLSLIPDMTGAYLIVLGLLVMIAFFWWELRHKNPVLKISVFRNNKVFMFSNLAALINYSATFAVALLLSYYLQDIKGFDPQFAGLILIAQPIVQAVFSPLTGKLSDKVEPRIVASAGMGLCVIGLVLFALMTPQTSLLVVIASLMFMGLGFALFSSPNTNAIMSSVERCDYGVASGMVSTMRLVGQMLSLGVAMLTFSVIMGRVEVVPGDPSLMSSIQVAFIVFAALCVIGMFASIVRGNVRKAVASGPQPAAQTNHQ